MNEKAEVTDVKKENTKMEKEILDAILELKNLLLAEKEAKETEVEVKSCDEMEEDEEKTKACGEMADEEEDKEKAADGKCPKCGKMLNEEKASPDPVLEAIDAEDCADNHKNFDAEAFKAEVLEMVSNLVSEKFLELKTEFLQKEEKNSENIQEKELNLEDLVDQLLNTDNIL